jgi:hypothetical protein
MSRMALLCAIFGVAAHGQADGPLGPVEKASPSYVKRDAEGRVVGLTLEAKFATDAWLATAKDEEAVEKLCVRCSKQVSVEGLMHALRFSRLRSLRLTQVGVRLNKAFIEGLAGLESLEELDLAYVEFEEEAVALLPRLKRVKNLTLFKVVGLADEHLSRVAQMDGVVSLTLRGDSFTAGGVSKLSAMKSLRLLTIREGLIGREALAGFRDVRIVEVADP